MWYLAVFLLLSLYVTMTWRWLQEASSPTVACSVSSTEWDEKCFGPAVVVGDAIIFQLELYQPSWISDKSSFRWIPIETCRINTTIPPMGQLPILLTKKSSTSFNDTNGISQKTDTDILLQHQHQQKQDQTCLVPLPDFARHRSSTPNSVQPLMARFLLFIQQRNDNDENLVGSTGPFYLTRIKQRDPINSVLGTLVASSSSSSTPRNLIQDPLPRNKETTIDGLGKLNNEYTSTMWIPYLKFGRNTPIRIRFVAEDRGYAILKRNDGILLDLFNATSYSPMVYVDELSLPHSSQVELAPVEENKPPIVLQVKFGSISPTVDTLNRQVHMAFDTAESFLTGPELDEIRYFLQDERLYRFALTQVISYLHIWLDYLAFRDEIRFYRGRQNLAGVSTTSVLTRLGCSVIIFLYLLDGGGTSWVVLISIFASCVTEAWKVWKLLQPTWNSKFPFVKFRQLQSVKDREAAEYDRIAFRYLAMVLYPLVAVWSLYALQHYQYSSWYSWFISNMANAVYTCGFISLCPQLYVNYRLKSVAHLPWKVFLYKIFNTFVDDAFAWLIEMPMKHRLMTLRDDVVFLAFLVQVYIYRVDKTRTNEFGYSYEREQERETINEKIKADSSSSLSRADVLNDRNNKDCPSHFVVIVLGDVGKSPRMQYHANSLLQAGHLVSLIGYAGEVCNDTMLRHWFQLINVILTFTFPPYCYVQDLIPSLQEIAKEPSGPLNVIRFSIPNPEIFKLVPPLYLIWRITSLSLYLLYILVIAVPKKRPASAYQGVDCVLVQNPPAVPLLAIVHIYCNFISKYFNKGCTPAMIIDWHNLVC
jgi:hypothetical protein